MEERTESSEREDPDAGSSDRSNPAPDDAPHVTPELSFDEPVDEAPAPDDDPDVRALRRRDKAFVFRVVLRASVALLLGFWIFLQLTSTDVGACAAQGFGTVTQ